MSTRTCWVRSPAQKLHVWCWLHIVCYTIAFAIMQIPSNILALKIRPRICIVVCELGWTAFTYVHAFERWCLRNYLLSIETQVRPSCGSNSYSNVRFPIHDRPFRIGLLSDHHFPPWMLVYQDRVGKTCCDLAHYRLFWAGHIGISSSWYLQVFGWTFGPCWMEMAVHWLVWRAFNDSPDPHLWQTFSLRLYVTPSCPICLVASSRLPT